MKTILYNGKIRTADGSFKEALLIEDGLIKRTGSNDEIKKENSPDAEMIDLKGRLAVPGFNDSHMHFLNVGYNFS